MAEKATTKTATVKRKSMITPQGMAMFVYVWEPRESINEGQPPQYQITLLFKKSQEAQLAALRKVVAAVAKEKFGTKLNGLRMPFSEVDDMENIPKGYAGGVKISAKSKNKPGVVDEDANLIDDQMDFYPGCLARISITPFAYDKKGSRGVTFLLNNVQKMKDGTRLDGRKSAEEEFGGADGQDDEDDPF